jgi:3-oxoacyl-[acyl-carrier protein] reductase
MDLGLRGWRTLVTGASSGIGRAIATLMHEEGARVVGVARRKGDVPRELAGAVEADLTDRGSERRVVDAAIGIMGGLDAVVSAAGKGVHGSLHVTDDETWDQGLELNLLQVTRLLRASLPALRDGGGRVLVLTALSGTEPRPDHAVSNTAKAGLAAMAKTLSREEAPAGVLVNCLAPGRIHSRQVARTYTPADEASFSAAHIPLGRFGAPEEAAPLAALLVSPRNTYVTGQTVHVDGGMAHTPA